MYGLCVCVGTAVSTIQSGDLNPRQNLMFMFTVRDDDDDDDNDAERMLVPTTDCVMVTCILI